MESALCKSLVMHVQSYSGDICDLSADERQHGNPDKNIYKSVLWWKDLKNYELSTVDLTTVFDE